VTRDAAAIGAGLAPVRDARTIRAGERIHVVGAGGAGASAAALLASASGAVVSGCDAGGPSPYTAALDAAGIVVASVHDPSHVTAAPRPDRLAVTKALTAVDPDHPELRAARDLGIPVEPWQQVIADAAVGRTLVAIAGTHGKSTTAGWLVHVLVEAGLDPSAFVGALLPAASTGGVPATARTGNGTHSWSRQTSTPVTSMHIDPRSPC
jgi:UDP-N-acetylmuramate--alanine ligase